MPLLMKNSMFYGFHNLYCSTCILILLQTGVHYHCVTSIYGIMKAISFFTIFIASLNKPFSSIQWEWEPLSRSYFLNISGQRKKTIMSLLCTILLKNTSNAFIETIKGTFSYIRLLRLHLPCYCWLLAYTILSIRLLYSNCVSMEVIIPWVITSIW